uniref:IMS import disulfide relay-system CHCH-CHCH-like Cx9C domain-containing protein n=1 Tax=Calcidiscus leptoporus TaxID=127549 RepID=A0A7S0IP74_9EUKA|mmetsp:Transcript_15457/g.35556  ORF Transcript_15457/g.35556 Transcript_15457/m.35556 type:complete len:133 (+) Transcript_15457:20-418(+)
MGNATSQKVVLGDGTIVGDSAEGAQAFGQAISRMHRIFRDCDGEFRRVSDAVNSHGRKSEQFAAAAEQLHACQRRREKQMAFIETRCGPAQGAFRICIEGIHENGAGDERQCLPVLHTFLDCAERALDADVG